MGTELDKATQSQLARGARMVEVLKQQQYSPMPVEEQVMILYAATRGFMDDVPRGRACGSSRRSSWSTCGRRSRRSSRASGTSGRCRSPRCSPRPSAAFKKTLLANGEDTGHPQADRQRPQHPQDHADHGAGGPVQGHEAHGRASTRQRRSARRVVRLLPEALGAAPASLEAAQELAAHPLGALRAAVKKVLLFCVTSSRGLCGGYNAKVIQAARARMEQLRAGGQGAAAGRHGEEGPGLFRFHNQPVDHRHRRRG